MRRRISSDWQLQARMMVSMLLLAALYLVFADVLFNYAGMDFAVVIVGGLLLVQYFYSDRLVMYTTGARFVSEAQEPELHDIVTRLAQMADVPKPKVAVVPSQVPNAFATGRNPSHAVVAVTQGLMQRLSPQEVEAVLAHEMTHIYHHDMTVMTIASFFATIAAFITRNAMWMGIFGGGFGGGGGGGFGGGGGRNRDNNGGGFIIVLVVSIAVWIISFFLINALSRYREYAADRGSAELTGAPSHLASALVKISSVMQRVPQRDLRQTEALNALFIIPAVAERSWTELFATHPSLEHRLAYLRKLEAQMIKA
ncbi:MAG TPA: zinc metalloprotease HtpX [Bacillota bacterium]|nr:zinc metalloprotease HtpX [Bacillota bacterium]